MPTAHLTKSKSISRKEAKEQEELDELRDTVLGSLLGPKPQLPTPQEVLSVGRKEVSTREENFYHDRLAHYAYALHHRPTAGRVQFAKDAKGAAGGDEEAGDEDEEGLLQEYMSVAGRWQEVSLLTDESDPVVVRGVAGMRPVDEGPKAAGGAAGATARTPAGGSWGREAQGADDGPHPPPLLDQLLGEPDVGASFAVRRRESLAATASTTRAAGRRSLDEGSRMLSGSGYSRGLNSSSSNFSIRPAPPPCPDAMLTSASGAAPSALPPQLSDTESSSITISSRANDGMSATGPRRWSSAVIPRATSLRPATARPAAGPGPDYGAGAGSAASFELRRSVDPSPHEDGLAVTAASFSGAGASVGGVSGAVGRRASFSLGPGSASQASLSGAGLGGYGTAAAAATAAAADPSSHPPVCLAGLPAAAFHAPHAALHRRASNSAAGITLAASVAPAPAAAAAGDNSASLTAMRSAWQLTAGADSACSLLGAQAAAPAQLVASGVRTDGVPPSPAASAQQVGPAGFSSCGVVEQSLAAAVGRSGAGGGDVAGDSGSLGAAGQAAWMPSSRLRGVSRTASCTAVIPSCAPGLGSGSGAAAAQDAWLWAREQAAASMQQRQAALRRKADDELAKEERRGDDEAGDDGEEGEQEEMEEAEEQRSDISEVEAADANGGADATAVGTGKRKKKKGKGGRLLEEGGRAVESSWRSFSAGVSALRAAAALGMGGLVGRTSMRFGQAPPAGAAAAGCEVSSAAGLPGAGGPPAVGPGTLMLSRRQRRASNVVLPFPYEHTSALAVAGAGDINSGKSGAAVSSAAAASSPVKGSGAHTPQSQLAAMLDTIRTASPAPLPGSSSPVASSKVAAPAALSARGPGPVARVPSFLLPHPPAGGPSASLGAAGGQAAAGGSAPVPSARPRNRRASLDETWLAASLQERAAGSPAAVAAAAAGGGSGGVGGMGSSSLMAAAPLYPPRRGSLEIARSGASFGVSAQIAPAAGSGGLMGTTAAPQPQRSFLKRAAAGGGSPVASPVAAAAGAAGAVGGGGSVKSPPVSKLGAFDRLVHSLAHALHKPGSKHH